MARRAAGASSKEKMGSPSGPRLMVRPIPCPLMVGDGTKASSPLALPRGTGRSGCRTTNRCVSGLPTGSALGALQVRQFNCLLDSQSCAGLAKRGATSRQTCEHPWHVERTASGFCAMLVDASSKL